MEVREDQYRLFQKLLEVSEIELTELVEAADIEQTMAMGTLLYGKEQGWVNIIEKEEEEIIPAQDSWEKIQKMLPERKFLYYLGKIIEETGQESFPMQEIAQAAKKIGVKVNEIIKWGTLRGWYEKQGKIFSIAPKGKELLEKREKRGDPESLNSLDDSELDVDELLFKIYKNTNIKDKGPLFLSQLPKNIDQNRVRKLLKNRPELAKIKKRTIRRVSLTHKGKKEIPNLKIKTSEKNILTKEDIVSGKWREIQLRPYDVTLKAELQPVAKCHPMQKIIQETRKAFLEMGFQEIVSLQVELSFWDFDALFQPQDHPSRDMQDTFYLKRPGEGVLPSKNIVESVKRTHENGGETGSTGWGYSWSYEEARRMVLRTHTTATSVRALAKNPLPPQKVFCVGRVFRNETITFKHLPEFHQVDGIIVDESASFCALLGTLQEFYRKMGFKKIKFKPAFFPYTEPSAEVFVWMDAKKCWIELGGCGVFRPEVTKPLGCKVPVLAWGLGLERLAMLRYGIDDIRILYGSDLHWLQEVALCQ